MKQHNFYLSFLKWFYNITGELDEYSLQEINRFGNNMYMLTTLALVSLFLFGSQDWGWLIILVALVLPNYRQEKLIKQLGLDVLEVAANQLPEARKHMFKRSIWQTVIVFLIASCTQVLIWNSRMPGDVITFEEFFYHYTPILMAIVIPLAFLICWISNRRKIKVIN